MRLRKYILVDRKPVAVSSEDWAAWMETADRRVAADEVGPYRVSTVFLGLNHNFRDDRAPEIFETMVFDGDNNSLECWRASTWEEAEGTHRKGCAFARSLMS